MQHTLGAHRSTPEAPVTSSHHDTTIKKKGSPRLRYLRFSLYILRGMLLLALTGTIFVRGASIIHQNAKALGFFVLNFDVPLPFLLIGLWGIVVLFLAIFTVATWVKVVSMVRLHLYLRRPALLRRQAA